MPQWAEKELTGWGRVWRATSTTARPERPAELKRIFEDAASDTLLAYGTGRSYGDAALNSGGRSVIMRRLDRFLDFDPDTGRLVAESGATFSDVISTFLPRGFMLPVAPGTGFATLGGGIANDVHGKNHHQVGSLGQHVEWFDLRLPGGELRRIEPARDDALFKATLGGVGLTGIIERLCVRLKRVPSNAVTVRKRRIRDLDQYLEAFAEEQDRAEYVVGWIDALAKGRDLGRGILEAASPSTENVNMRPRNAQRVPIDFPGFALNPVTVRAFNEFYYRHVPPEGIEQRLPYQTFLFPLDAIQDWNRIYGKRGFHQFQCVVPFAEGGAALRKMLGLIANSGRGSFLAVLKSMGAAGKGFLSFPQPGYTLALDFPNVPDATAVIAQLERMTCDHGGRTYLAKDSTLSAENLRRMYPDLHKFQEVLAQIDPGGRMDSDLCKRLRLREARR
jgi:decaprenylphospho-beta-D-ribofuranose 2-oxidase